MVCYNNIYKTKNNFEMLDKPQNYYRLSTSPNENKKRRKFISRYANFFLVHSGNLSIVQA